MATKTVINCMEHSITQPNQGISIIIDQHTDDQQVYNASSNSNIIKIQHSNEQSLQQQQLPQQHQQYFTLNNRNNKNNKTLIDINRNDDDLHYDPHRVVAAKNEHVLQINCSSSTSNDISREIKEKLENTQTEAIQLEYNGVLTERGNDRNDDHHNEVQCNGEKKFNLAKNDDGHINEEAQEILTKYSTPQRVEEDEEESGQTASQQQKAQQQVHHNGNGNSKHRENGQNSTTNQLKLQLTTSTTTADRNNDEEHKDDNEKQPNNDDHDHDDDDHTKTQDHYEVTNREDDNDDDDDNSSSSSGGIGSGCAISSSGAVGLVQREVVDFSHGKRSLNEENSNSLLTKADASTCTKSTTLLTINAHKVATQKNDLNNFENLTNDKKINHVVKIQIKPNNNNNNSDCNTLTEKQITVVKIENLQEFENETTKLNNNNHKENLASENIENKENQKENTLHSQSQLNDATTMVQKPSNNSAATVTVVSTNSNAHGNGNANLNTVSHTSGAVTAASGTTVTELNVSNPNNYLYYMMSSGQFSPCDTLDSGTGSDLESNGQQQQSSPNLQIKKSSNSSSSSTSSSVSNNSLAPMELHLKTTKIRVNNSSSSNSLEMQQRQCSFTDSEESEASSLSCDSLHSNEFLRQSSTSPIQLQKTTTANGQSKKIQSFLPDSLLREIKNLKFSTNDYEAENEEEDDILPTLKSEIKTDVYEPLSNQDYIKSHEFIQSRKNLNNLPTTMSSSLKRASLPSKTFVLNTEDGTFIDTKMNSMPRTYEADKYYNFHVNEHDNFRSFGNNGSMTAATATNGGNGIGESLSIADYETKSLHDDVFAGYRDLRCVSNTSTIRSSKGTVRGVKNRVRNGIATFLQLQQPNIKNYKEKDSGKVVLYTTSMGIIRDTYAKCSNVKQILRTLLVKFEERDVFMSVEYQQEIKERMHSDIIKVPQLYVEGQHIGDADTVERLNESGELRQLLKPYKSISTTYTCQTCGGYRLLPCPSCNGSKKSVHRNHFTAEFVALKCMNCDEVGLVKCHNC
ncbi:glutaredoxin domain-containing cysteine-rich protein CG12206-like [Calliphora vicina]|uniref:glutaredoxin domain-containing cysteine-rich protein CG12206-like n=1 Tax=Calliphora vicina TaxID=7373 RepID=UPI00325AB7C0